MIITDDENMAKRARYLTTQAKEEGMEYIHNEVGRSYGLLTYLQQLVLPSWKG